MSFDRNVLKCYIITKTLPAMSFDRDVFIMISNHIYNSYTHENNEQRINSKAYFTQLILFNTFSAISVHGIPHVLIICNLMVIYFNSSCRQRLTFQRITPKVMSVEFDSLIYSVRHHEKSFNRNNHNESSFGTLSVVLAAL